MPKCQASNRLQMQGPAYVTIEEKLYEFVGFNISLVLASRALIGVFILRMCWKSPTSVSSRLLLPMKASPMILVASSWASFGSPVLASSSFSQSTRNTKRKMARIFPVPVQAHRMVVRIEEKTGDHVEQTTKETSQCSRSCHAGGRACTSLRRPWGLLLVQESSIFGAFLNNYIMDPSRFFFIFFAIPELQ